MFFTHPLSLFCRHLSFLFCSFLLLIGIFGDYPNPKRGYPGFWWFEYGMKNVNFYLEFLEKRGFIQINENGKYSPTELGKQEVTDNYYVVYMRNAPGMTIDNIEASDDFSVWGINRRLAGGDPSKWEDILIDIWNEIDEYKAAQKAKKDAELKAQDIDPEKLMQSPHETYLDWRYQGFRNDMPRIFDALNVDRSDTEKLPIGYLQAIMRRVLDSFLEIDRAKDMTVFFDRVDLIKSDLQQLSAAEMHGIKFSYSPSLLLWNVETHQKELFSIVVENSSSAQMDKICSLKTDRGRMNSNQRWKNSIGLLEDGIDDDLKSVIQSEFKKLEKAREEMSSE